MRTVAIIQARMSSTRLPGKILKPLGDLPVVGWCVRAAKAISGVDEVAVATSEGDDDDAVAAWCKANHVTCVRGPLHDVLARYALAARTLKATHVMRLTADCPLLDPEVCAQVLALRMRTGSDYASNVTVPRTWPQGLDCEAFTAEALYRAETEATLPAEREHVTPYLRGNPQLFNIAALTCPLPGLGLERWTVDYPNDYAFIAQMAAHFYAARAPRYTEMLEILKSIPEPHNRNPA